jgi:hypothetical protein
MNYETEYDLNECLTVTVDYYVIWDVDYQERDYFFVEIDSVWADLLVYGKRDEPTRYERVNVFPVLSVDQLDRMEKHCEAHAERMMQEDP